MISFLTKSFSSSFNIKDITKDILGKSVPINATSIAKVAAAEMVKKKIEELFAKENVIVLSNNKNIREIEKILERKNIKFKIGNFFNGKWEDFNENSISICVENIPFEKMKNLAIEFVKDFNQKIILKDTYNIYLVS